MRKARMDSRKGITGAGSNRGRRGIVSSVSAAQRLSIMAGFGRVDKANGEVFERCGLVR